MAQTLDEIRRKGLQALRRELGRTGLIRFLQQFETGRGDYVQERRQWVDDVSLEELRVRSRHVRTGQGKKSHRKP